MRLTDGRNPANQLIGRLSYYLHCFLHPMWWGISSINSMTLWATLQKDKKYVDAWEHLRSILVQQTWSSEDTALKTNIEPENAHFEKEKHLQNHQFWGSMMVFGCVPLGYFSCNSLTSYPSLGVSHNFDDLFRGRWLLTKFHSRSLSFHTLTRYTKIEIWKDFLKKTGGCGSGVCSVGYVGVAIR